MCWAPTRTEPSAPAVTHRTKPCQLDLPRNDKSHSCPSHARFERNLLVLRRTLRSRLRMRMRATVTAYSALLWLTTSTLSMRMTVARDDVQQRRQLPESNHAAQQTQENGSEQRCHRRQSAQRVNGLGCKMVRPKIIAATTMTGRCGFVKPMAHYSAGQSPRSWASRVFS